MAAGTEKKGEVEETPTLQQLMAVMQQMQVELVTLKRKQARSKRRTYHSTTLRQPRIRNHTLVHEPHHHRPAQHGLHDWRWGADPA